MNILFMTIGGYDENIIKPYESLLQQFNENGHSVFVVCTAEKRLNKNTERKIIRGIDVLRVKTGNITKNKSLIEKGISTLTIDTLFKNAIKKYFRNIKFDLVIYPTPPITLVGTISWLKRKFDAHTYLLLKDIFPQNAVDLDMMSKTGPIYRYFRNKEKNLYRVSDYIGCMSPANCKYLLTNNKEVSKSQVEVCPNCITVSKNEIDSNMRINIRKKYNIPLNKKVFVYGGNLGKPQGIDFVLNCIKICSSIDNAYFLIVGGGSEFNKIQNYFKTNNINNATLINSLSDKEYQSLAGSCDVGLVFLDYRFTIPNFPSRILSYMNVSIPVVVAADPNTDIGDIVEANNFGWKCLSNSTDEFLICVNKALNSDLKIMGVNAHKYLEKNYDVKNGYEIIINHFK